MPAVRPNVRPTSQKRLVFLACANFMAGNDCYRGGKSHERNQCQVIDGRDNIHGSDGWSANAGVDYTVNCHPNDHNNSLRITGKTGLKILTKKPRFKPSNSLILDATGYFFPVCNKNQHQAFSDACYHSRNGGPTDAHRRKTQSTKDKNVIPGRYLAPAQKQ